ncbi:MAG: protein-L-isoaspartate(D-aspartate) O-methyltransferase [Chloroflexi bacterium]|nr:protein-L-isoaspartate(D-aspartate) O-methyltransferase [Chloroflexota bacterium]
MDGRESAADSSTLQRVRLASSLRRKGIRDTRILNAIGQIPREDFVDDCLRHDAYQDTPLPIGEGQTISQPYVVALMTEALSLTGKEHVLEIGTGSGYQTAILCCLARSVVSVERFAELALVAERRLCDLGCDNCDIFVADGTMGWPDSAPYDAIIVSAAAPSAPEPLLNQLTQGGRCVIPVGDREKQTLLLLENQGDDVKRRDLGAVRFVPLVGEHGWPEDVG